MRTRLFALAILLFAGIFLLNACGPGGLNSLRPQSAAADETATPAPHPSPTSDFTTVNSPVCKVAEWDATVTEANQGDMLAWSPKGDDLAFLAQKDTTLYVGDLAISLGPAFTNMLDPIPDQSVYGDVTWSPDASQIAFVALRSADNLYTVMVVRPDGKGLRDLFPGKTAHTDNYASPKSILDWPSQTLLEVELTCGPDCVKTAQLDVTNGATNLSTNTRRAKDRLGGTIKRHILTYDTQSYPVMTAPNWSADGKKVVYTNENDEIWVIETVAKTRYPIDLNRKALETKWSRDNRFLAVRTSRWVTVYSWSGCP